MKRAFTLAEVLITLMIIGVVVALVSPTIAHKINGTNSENIIDNTTSNFSKSWDGDDISEMNTGTGNSTLKVQHLDPAVLQDCKVLVINNSGIVCRR